MWKESAYWLQHWTALSCIPQLPCGYMYSFDFAPDDALSYHYVDIFHILAPHTILPLFSIITLDIMQQRWLPVCLFPFFFLRCLFFDARRLGLAICVS